MKRNQVHIEWSRNFTLGALSVLTFACTSPGGSGSASTPLPSNEAAAATSKTNVDASGSCQNFPYNYDSPLPFCPNTPAASSGSTTDPAAPVASNPPAVVTPPAPSTPTNPATPVVTPPAVDPAPVVAAPPAAATPPTVQPAPPVASAPPADTAPAAPVCTPELRLSLGQILDQRFRVPTNEVATSCIDDATPTLADNLPFDVSHQARYMNTCGNRYCQQHLGFAAGRVIEYDPQGISTVECLHDVPPQGVGNACAASWTGPALIESLQVAIPDVAALCTDGVAPDIQQSLPENDLVRFDDLCGARYCRAHGHSDGIAVESYAGMATVNCFNDPSDLFVSLAFQVVDVARNCIDDANPDLASNMPSANNIHRFMSTCGDRYCRALSPKYVSGKVSDFYAGQGVVQCMKGP